MRLFFVIFKHECEHLKQNILRKLFPLIAFMTCVLCHTPTNIFSVFVLCNSFLIFLTFFLPLLMKQNVKLRLKVILISFRKMLFLLKAIFTLNVIFTKKSNLFSKSDFYSKSKFYLESNFYSKVIFT